MKIENATTPVAMKGFAASDRNEPPVRRRQDQRAKAVPVETELIGEKLNHHENRKCDHAGGNEGLRGFRSEGAAGPPATGSTRESRPGRNRIDWREIEPS